MLRSREPFALRTAVVLVVLAALSRVVPHPWNFTPQIALALFAGAAFPRAWGLLVTLAALAVGDTALGHFPYAGMLWVYGATAGIAMFGGFARGPLCDPRVARSVGTASLAALGSGFAFFLVTNFGVWAAGEFYPRTADGLAECFAMGVPFYRNQLVADVGFAALLFGARALALRFAARRCSTAAS